MGSDGGVNEVGSGSGRFGPNLLISVQTGVENGDRGVRRHGSASLERVKG